MVDIRILDDAAQRRRLDPSGMGERIAALSSQCREAWEQAMALTLPSDYREVERVVVAGMGGSGVGGDLLAGLALLGHGVPIHVWRDYDLPSWVDTRTLVIVSSYSGDTEETLSAYEAARQRGARVIAVTTGGRLGERAGAQGVPLVTFHYHGEPRTALGYSFIVPLALVWRLGLLPDKTDELHQALDLLEEWVATYGPESATPSNPAKELAGRLYGRVVVVYGATFLAAVARRWKTQVNENAKGWAFAEVLPELDHNAVVGYQFPLKSGEQLFVVLLQSGLADPRVSRRYQVTAELLQQGGIPFQVVEFTGATPLVQLLQAVLLGDFTSYYLALLNGVDPAPVPAIDYLKRRLAEG